jgi:S1-C subfamily serine protease
MSPAHRGGLQKYDVITAVNGKKIADGDAFGTLVGESAVGEELKLTVNRLGKVLEITVTVGDRNESMPQTQSKPQTKR